MPLFGRKSEPTSPGAPRSSAEPADTYLLPRDPASNSPLPPIPQPGYYQGFTTLSQQKFWDKATRTLILERVQDPPPIRHFSAQEAVFWRAVLDHLIPQHDRTPEKRIPLLEPIDDRLYHHRTEGYRYEDMPPDPEVYRIGITAIDAESQEQFGGDFLYLPWKQQDLVLETIHNGQPQGGQEIWKHMSIERFWQFILQDAISSYYAHPFAWDEIGFGGPAYPRAYTRLERGEPEPWEVEETRYAWAAPPSAVSDKVDATIDDNDTQSHHGSGGTH